MGFAFARYSQAWERHESREIIFRLRRNLRIFGSFAAFAEFSFARCTNSGHLPVRGLHSLENTADKSALFLLTANLKGVELNRSLTVS